MKDQNFFVYIHGIICLDLKTSSDVLYVLTAKSNALTSTAHTQKRRTNVMIAACVSTTSRV